MENLTFTYPSHTAKGCVPLSSDVRVLDSYSIAYQHVTPSQMTEKGVYIMAYWTNGAFKSSAHTIAVSYNGETYTAYNLHGDGHTEEIDINNYNGMDFICGYYLTDRTQRI